jgi:hypothetical protein
MTTYYRDAGVWVTGEWVEVGPRRLPISELTYVWHRRGRPTARTATRLATRYGLIALLVAPVAAGAGLLAYLAARAHGPLAVLGTAAVLTVTGLTLLWLLLSPVLEFPLMALERSYDRGLWVREIWVRWRGEDLLLLRTSDAARFGKIYRAIERAMERVEG